MFLVNSCLGLFTAATIVAPLLPKLRGHFAEFLNKSYPDHLMILSSSTCVGLRYGHPNLSSNFSRQREFTNFHYFNSFPTTPSLTERVLHYAPASRCSPPLPSGWVRLSFCVIASVKTSRGGAGISACCPSSTAFALNLGPD